jgi:hypothetical protein
MLLHDTRHVGMLAKHGSALYFKHIKVLKAFQAIEIPITTWQGIANKLKEKNKRKTIQSSHLTYKNNYTIWLCISN